MGELILENVSYRYQKGVREVFHNINCKFEERKFQVITGPSGSGKTTLLSLMAGLDRPEEGQIIINGRALHDIDLDQYRREEIAMIFQSFQLFPLLTVLENVQYPMDLIGIKKKEAKERAKELLLSIGIEKEKQKRFPIHLSGGEQQRVAIARALSTGAKVLLADEPTGNLDEENTNHIVDILKKLAHEQGYCVIVVTHDMQIAEQADCIYCMKNGTLEKN